MTSHPPRDEADEEKREEMPAPSIHAMPHTRRTVHLHQSRKETVNIARVTAMTPQPKTIERKLRMKCSGCGHWNRVPVNKVFVEPDSPEPKVKVLIPMYEPLEVMPIPLVALFHSRCILPRLSESSYRI